VGRITLFQGETQIRYTAYDSGASLWVSCAYLGRAPVPSPAWYRTESGAVIPGAGVTSSMSNSGISSSFERCNGTYHVPSLIQAL